MKIIDIITEADKQPALSKYAAYDRLEEIYNQITVDDFTATPEEAQGLLADAKRQYKITGSRFPRRANRASAGDYYNWIYRILDSVLSQHGQREFPSAANVKDFAKGIAAYYHGDAKWQKPIRWQNSSGGSRQEPEWTVIFEPEHMDDVWADLSKRGKTVYISGKLSKTPQTYLQFGSILVGKDASITGPFSDNPERTDFLTFQSAKILRNDYYTQHEITPQQAHQIQDIAKTKNQNAQDMLRAIARALNEPKMDKALARVLDSTRIDPAFKVKLNQIVASAKDYDDSQDLA